MEQLAGAGPLFREKQDSSLEADTSFAAYLV